jgi:large subunit ribosomal protein L4
MKASDNAIMVIEDFDFDAPKTKDFLNVLKALGIDDKKSLIVLGETNNNVYLSSRNFKTSQVVKSSELSTYKILHANNLVLLEGSLEGIEETLSK